MSSDPANPPRSFDEALDELADCVRKMDTGNLPLEEVLSVLERGVKVQQECLDLLDATEQRVVELVGEPGAVSERERPELSR